MFDLKYQQLKIIKGIQFTAREIDILASIVSGRSAQAVGSLLNISSRTVETHLRNMMMKIGCNSRERLMLFIETSGKFAEIRKHYLNLLTEDYLHQKLHAISNTAFQANDKCFVTYSQAHETLKALAQRICKNLKDANVTSTLKTRSQNTDINNSEDNSIHFLSKDEINASLLTKIQGLTPPPAFLSDDSNLIIVSTSKKSPAVPYVLRESNYIWFTNHTAYYFLFFEILKKLIPEKISVIQKIQNECKEHIELIGASTDSSIPLITSEDNSPARDFNGKTLLFYKINILFSFFKRKYLLAGGTSLVLSCLLGMWLQTAQESHPSQVVSSKISTSVSDNLLQRPEILEDMAEKLATRDSLALIGLGGCGKTILAKQFAAQQAFQVIWEINAESQEKIADNFESLAYALIKSEEEKKIFRTIVEIEDKIQRQEKILNYVRDQLNSSGEWLLIFDNVEKFADIQNYFPPTLEGWGKGKVIILSQNDNLKHNSSIDHIISIKELTLQQKLEIFKKIINSKKGENEKNKNELTLFLQELPSFPLDITIAAYYIKATSISNKDYLERLKQQSSAFVANQEEILRESDGYSKARYNIITLSLDKIIKENANFLELLLLVSLMDHQCIPRFLLDALQPDIIVDQFIHNLKRYSLAVDQISYTTLEKPVFFIHKSTQDIILNYLTQHLEINKREELIKSIAHIFETYTYKAVDEEFRNHKLAQFLIPHLQAVLSHKLLFPEKLQTLTEVLLGILYSYTGHYLEATAVLEGVLESSAKVKSMNAVQNAEALRYLGIAYSNRGNYEHAKILFEKSLILYQKFLPQDYLGLSKTLIDLGSINRSLGNLIKAKGFLEKAVSLHQQHFPNYIGGIARAYKYLGMVHKNLGEYDKSQEILRQSIVYYQQINDPTGKAGCLVFLGDIHRELGNNLKAAELIEQAVKIYKDYHPPYHSHIAWSLGYLGNTYRVLGQYTKSIHLLTEALDIYQQVGSSNGTAWILTQLANVYQNLGNEKRAKELLEEGIHIYKKGSHNSNEMTWALSNLANIHNACGNYTQAEELLKQCLVLYEKASLKPHVYIANIQLNLGAVYKQMGHYAKAKEFIEQSKATYIQHYGPQHIEVARGLKELGHIYLLEGTIDLAEQLLNRSAELQLEHPEYYQTLQLLAELNLKKSLQCDQPVQAQQYKSRALKSLQDAIHNAAQYLPSDAPALQNLKNQQEHLSGH